MTTTRIETIRTPDAGRSIAVVGDIYRFLATAEDTDGKYAIWEAIVPPGGGPPPHVHSRPMHTREQTTLLLLRNHLALPAFFASVACGYHMAEDIFQDVCIAAISHDGGFHDAADDGKSIVAPDFIGGQSTLETSTVKP